MRPLVRCTKCKKGRLCKFHAARAQDRLDEAIVRAEQERMGRLSGADADELVSAGRRRPMPGDDAWDYRRGSWRRGFEPTIYTTGEE